MRKVAEPCRIGFWTALAFTFGTLSCVSMASSQEVPEEPAPEGRAGQEADTVSAPRVRLEATLAWLAASAVGEVEVAIGCKLGPVDDQLVVTPERKEKLLALIAQTPAAKVIASSSALTSSGKPAVIHLEGELSLPIEFDTESIVIGGGPVSLAANGVTLSIGGLVTEPDFQEIWHPIDHGDWGHLLVTPKITTTGEGGAQIEVVQEITYPSEYDAETITIGGLGVAATTSASENVLRVTISNWLRRKIVASLKLTPMVRRSGEIGLVVTQDVSVETVGKKADGTYAGRPFVNTWHKTTSLILPDGTSFVLKEFLLKSPLELAAQSIARRPPPAEKPSPQKKEILKKLETIIPEVAFEDARLGQVVDFLSRECGVNIVLDAAVFADAKTPDAQGEKAPSLDGTGTTLRLKNVPMKDVLKYILRYKKLKYVVEDYGVAIVPHDYVPPESLQTEVFRFDAGGGGYEVERISTESVKPVESAESQEPEAAASETMEDFLRQSGIAWPSGSSVRYDKKTGTLIVTNTPTNMALIREMASLWVGKNHDGAAAPKYGELLLTFISARALKDEGVD